MNQQKKLFSQIVSNMSVIQCYEHMRPKQYNNKNYYKLRINFEKNSQMIIFTSLLTTLKKSNTFYKATAVSFYKKKTLLGLNPNNAMESKFMIHSVGLQGFTVSVFPRVFFPGEEVRFIRKWKSRETRSQSYKRN